jgi:uncharacterized membrane protein YqjE
MSNVDDDQNHHGALELRIRRSKALMAVIMSLVAIVILIFIAIVHPFWPLKIAAVLGVLLGILYIAYAWTLYRHFAGLESAETAKKRMSD